MNTALTFKVGDVVRLMSGGPLMCITLVTLGSAECTYWNDNADIYGKDSFAFDALELACSPRETDKFREMQNAYERGLDFMQAMYEYVKQRPINSIEAHATLVKVWTQAVDNMRALR